MSRPHPTVKIPDLKRPEKEMWTLELKTITPMFGGSAVPREVDPDYPVRPSSVRGHLRFWWRATSGAKYSSSEALFKAEEALWGSAQQYGAVSLKVQNQSCERPEIPLLDRVLTYATFPFQEQRASHNTSQVDAAKATRAVQFELCVRCSPDHLLEVQQALYAWVLLGGIGARTRRGCGSLRMEGVQVMRFAPSSASLLTTLPSLYLEGAECRDPLSAWKKAVEVYRNFRQGEDFARTHSRNSSKTPKTPGRSWWPEPDTLRRVSGQRFLKHEPKHPISGYPRADLGLPIVFHFQGKELPDQTLESSYANGTRFASPIITKAIERDGKFYPLIAVLNAPHVWEGGDLKTKDALVSRNQVELNETQRLQISPLEQYGGKPIRKALLEHAKAAGFVEVKL